MMNPRFFCPEGLVPDSEIPLPAPVAHHAERGQRGLGLGHRVAQLGHVQAGDHLAFRHPVVLFGQHGFQRSGEFAADVDRACRLQCAAGRDADHQLAGDRVFGEVAPARVVAVAGEQGEQDDGADAGQRDERPAPAAVGEAGGGVRLEEVGRGGVVGLFACGHDREGSVDAALSVEFSAALQPPPNAL